MFFKDVIGQEEIKQRLVESVKQNRVSHTQLFLGPEGSGQLALALAYAQYINCENRGEGDSCGQCPSCIKSQKLIHPDIHYSYPVFKLKPGSENPALSIHFIKEWREAVLENAYMSVNDWLDFIKAENKQGNISAGECRDIINKLNLKTFESEYKILIMWHAEYLEKEGNILLKLLEEPPDKTLLILIAQNRDQLLNTIVSRSQIIGIPGVDDKEMLQALMNRKSLERNEALKIIRRTEGNYNEAVHLIEQPEDANQNLFNTWMQLLYSSNATGLVKWVDEVSRIGRENQKGLFRYALEYLHECLVLQHRGEDDARLQPEEKRLAAWLIQRMNNEDWSNMMDLFDKAHYHIERNAHPKILLMHLSLRLQHLISRKKLSLAG